MSLFCGRNLKILGRKSTKENKNIYWRAREEAGMTREQASEAMGFVSGSRIEKYENEMSPVHPEEVLAMSKAYKKPALCNYYCSHACPIGQEYVPEIRVNNLAQIVLQMLSTMNELERARDRFIDITADGEISDDELSDFAKIERGIENLSMASDALSLWVSSMVSSGKIDAEKLQKAREALE